MYFLICEKVVGIQVFRHEESRGICVDKYPSDTFPVKCVLIQREFLWKPFSLILFCTLWKFQENKKGLELCSLKYVLIYADNNS